MKSPNALLTSYGRRNSSRVRTPRALCSTLILTLLCPLAIAGCQSTGGADSSRGRGDNPYSKYDPKSPEEEAYYRDVYSGEWSEEGQSDLRSVYKHSGSTKLPVHWTMLPPGAKTLDEIRSEAANRQNSEARATGRALPTPPPIPETTSSSTYTAAPVQTGTVSASQNGLYSAQTPLQSNAQAQNTYANPVAGASVPYQQVQPNPAYTANAASVASGVEYMAQAPAQYPVASDVVTPNASAPVVDSTSAVYPSNAPSTPAVPAVYPTNTPATYPNNGGSSSNGSTSSPNYQLMGLSAANELIFSSETIVRGQEPEGNATDDSALEMKTENVNVKLANPGAATKDSSVAKAISAAISYASRKLPVKIDPSIAKTFEGVKRPQENPSAPDDKNVERNQLDEYVLSGGDSKGEFYSREDWSIENLDVEDSAAHFDTVDGRILAEPTNRIFIYSPRFGAVRQVVGPVEGDYREGVEIANVTDVATEDAVAEGTDVRSQEVRPLGANNSLQAEGAETTVGTMASTGFEGVMEGDSQVRLGAMLTSETIDDLSSEDASLVFDGAVAAQGWSSEQGVAVSTDLVNAFSNAYIEGPATIYQIKDDTKTSKLRVIKVANKDAALPGELVEFTLRFENIGEELIGNVTILDSLSPRLRYVDGTAQSSVSADLVASLNEQGALVLRWEITDPLEPKEFGVVRFICKVQ
ncbi:MAG: hypothetical protein ACI4NP_01740 [Thermoguttaceae bacterium]